MKMLTIWCRDFFTDAFWIQKYTLCRVLVYIHVTKPLKYPENVKDIMSLIKLVDAVIFTQVYHY